MSAEHAATQQSGDVEAETHGTADHGADGGHDDPGHGSEALGPPDVYAWGAFILGTGLGLVVAVCIAIAIGGRLA